ncbi:type I restriction endonuclease subunit R [Rhodovulum sulfidophilum]|uniref:Type I restriction enzyme endonuclease subunit n=1 Tax=Rhodovulum sulfidophilum TaxID=35806 RepID=A0ABS1RV99_RHOSU|nr:type I restriction endonuclease subunit R [Rhodovulum sulfidophilum]MBL3609996.1 type I restriction endonuclease subunit R [Rhodovulum sulfidophilum]MCE8454995.1 type I restriction endonuclease subunit R [Rhodovulum sulfidophilum]
MSQANDQFERDWVEEPAADLLRVLFDYKSLAPDEVRHLREGLSTEPVLTVRLAECLKRLNPWLDEDAVRRTVAAVTRVSAVDVMEANEVAYTALTYGVTAAHAESGRRQDRNVRFFDFDDPSANTFEFARQVAIKGPRKEIIPDLIVYVNGLPIAVIECKSPSLADPMGEAIRQFRRYESRDEFSGLGAPRLFETAQISIALARDTAKFGTTLTPVRHWAEWKDPYPLTLDALSAQLGRTPTGQDILLAGLLAPANLLDVLRNFVIFETIDGRRIKRIARYQQFVAVGKAIERIRTAVTPQRRGGVIHHTQGSGKSLTMVFLATKLRRLREAENPTLVIVTDRTDLDDQITGQFQRSGFANPIQAESGATLRSALSGGAGTTVLTTVHKFHSAVPKGSPIISAARNVFVMVDEAHRTQYGALAARMRAGLPNACMIAFTGTPIDKTDRNTREVFGDYLHRYLIDQAVKDGATVPIFYEMRDAQLRIDGRDLERDVRAAFPELSDEEFQKLKRGMRLHEKLAGAKVRVEAVAKDILSHYRSTIEPNGFKAQIVTVSRDVAVSYVEALRNLGAPECALIMSTSNNDSARLQAHHLSKSERDTLIGRFKKRDDPLRILVVCDMLLTGFDAPVEQVLYLDAPLREHTLLQAIARVNRTAEGKTYGLVVDYWGDNRRIADALDMFSDEDGITSALRPLSEKIQLLESRHRAAIRLFEGLHSHDDAECVELLRPDDIRAKFELDFLRFSEAMDMVLPDPKALEDPYPSDLKWLSRIRVLARRAYHEEPFDPKDYGAKVGEIITNHLSVTGVEQLLVKFDILDPAFRPHLDRLRSGAAKAAEIEHAIRHEIHVHRDENPAAYASLWEQLEGIVNDKREARVSAASALSQLEAIVGKAADIRSGAACSSGGLSGTAAAILPFIDPDLPETERSQSAAGITEALEAYAEVIDWQQKEDVQRQMRRSIKVRLRSLGLDAQKVEATTAKIMDVARARYVG